MPTIIITLRLPDKCLSPNARVHWAVKSRAVRAYRNLACYEAIIYRQLHKSVPSWTRATAQCRFFFAKNAPRDADNLLASTKPIWDGLKDAAVIADDSGLTHLPVIVSIDKASPRLVIEVTEDSPFPLASATT